MMDEVSDESSKELEKRKYYIANYKITLKGLLIDEEEFQVSPAITRALTVIEVDTKIRKRKAKIEPPRTNNFNLDITFLSGVTQLSEVFNYTADIVIQSTDNVTSYSVYINNNYVGDDLSTIQITTNDTLKIIVVKNDNTKTSTLKSVAYLV
jgi:hypothetical protein